MKSTDVGGAPRELVEETLGVAGHELSILRPPDAEALLDEEAFEREEFLPYWAEVWPSALVLADVVAGLPVRGTSVLELGCGLALPSLVAALRGGRVLATDWSPDAVALAARNGERNGAHVATAVRSWRDPEGFRDGPWDLVLASDVLYERRDVAPLLEVLPRLVDDGDVLLADPGRPAAAAFLAAATQDWDITTAAGRAEPRVTVHQLRKRR